MSPKKTRTFKLNKLVRDKIVQDHIKSGAKIQHRKLNPKQKRAALLDKIIEEAQEAKNSKKLLPEIADIQEAINQLIEDERLAKSQIAAEQEKKRNKNGGFKNGDYIGEETWPAEHHWAKYYAAEPERFPEVK